MKSKTNRKIKFAYGIEKIADRINLVVKNINKSGLNRKFLKKIVDETIFFANPPSFKRQKAKRGKFTYRTEDFNLSIIFLDKKKMLQLGMKYKHKSRQAANVLTFNLSKNPSISDIFICVPQAKKEASLYNLSADVYISFLIIHGILHSMGFRHEYQVFERKKMESLEEKILSSLYLSSK